MSDESLRSLHTALIDARQGYRTAIGKAETPAVREILRAVDHLHAEAHEDIHRILTSRGVRLDDDGSMMGTVHATVVSVRSAVVGLDEGSLSSFASGEENNLDSYDAAIAAEPGPEVRNVLSDHRNALAAKIQLMKTASE